MLTALLLCTKCGSLLHESPAAEYKTVLFVDSVFMAMFHWLAKTRQFVFQVRGPVKDRTLNETVPEISISYNCPWFKCAHPVKGESQLL